MTSAELAQLIKAAQHVCGEKGKGLTEKRQRVLEIMLKQKSVMSAYELTDAYNAQYSPPIKAMSIYRILDYLESAQLVHRLLSANKFMACANQQKCNDHQLSLFLICTSCQQVEELAIAEALNNLLSRSTAQSGFQIHGSQLEINGLCSQCQSTGLKQIKGKASNEYSANQ